MDNGSQLYNLLIIGLHSYYTINPNFSSVYRNYVQIHHLKNKFNEHFVLQTNVH